jgi:hypothetical protein
MKIITLFLGIVIALSLSGCNSYRFNNQNYSNASDALAAHSKYLEETKQNISIRKATIPGKVMVITPTKETCEAVGITRTGTPKKELTAYLGEFMESDYAYFSKFLSASRAFSNVESRIADYPIKDAHALSGKYSAIIYLHILSPSQIGWYVLKSGSHQPIQINIDAKAAPGAPKIDSWIDNIIAIYSSKS